MKTFWRELFYSDFYASPIFHFFVSLDQRSEKMILKFTLMQKKIQVSKFLD